VQQLVGAGEQGKRIRTLGHWKGMTQNGDGQDAQGPAFGWVKVEVGLGVAAGIESARLDFVHPCPSVKNLVQEQE